MEVDMAMTEAQIRWRAALSRMEDASSRLLRLAQRDGDPARDAAWGAAVDQFARANDERRAVEAEVDGRG